jgi:hypothetical protein
MTQFKLINALPSGNGLNEDGNYLIEADEVSDGYHTMTELYEHRFALFCALIKQCNFTNQVAEDHGADYPLYTLWKSKFHEDGTMYDGWFIAGIIYSDEKQLSYHLPLGWWDRCEANIYGKAPKWDGHTSKDVIHRLGEL